MSSQVTRIVAERNLICIKADGTRLPVTLRIGMPYPDGESWACPVALEGVERKLPDIHGTDSFQALMLAQRLLLQLMTYVIEDGGHFQTVEEGLPVDIKELFVAGI